MFAATRRWFRRNRGPIAVGFGVVGAGYVATQYLVAKLNDARERMSSDRIAKENLRRRFEQNQEDCTFTVLALLPTVTSNVLESMNTEGITYQIQHMKGGAGGGGAARSVKSEGAASASPPSIADTLVTEDEGRSMMSLQSESGVHASQIAQPTDAAGATAQEGAPVKRKTKRQLWDELTISSITRSYTLLYTVALLVMLTRIQLNLLGRRSYLSSVVSLATGSAQATISLENNDDDNPEHFLGSSDFEVNRKYLAFSWWLLNRSWEDIMHRVETAVRTVFGRLSPRDTISLETFYDLTRQVRHAVELGPVPPSKLATPNSSTSSNPYASTSSSRSQPPPQQSRWLSLVLPPPDLEDYVLRESGILADSATASFDVSAPPAPSAQQAALRRMLDETADLVDSPTFTHVLTLILDAGFATLIENKVAPGAFDLPPWGGNEGEDVGGGPGGASGSSTEVVRLRHEKAVQLPKVLSVLTRQAHVIGSGMPNEYLQEMETIRDLEAFAAVVYSSNWESEIREDELLRQQQQQQQQQEQQKQPSQPQPKSQPQPSQQPKTAAETIVAPPSPVEVRPVSPIAIVEESLVEESLVIVDESFPNLESAWERAVEKGKEEATTSEVKKEETEVKAQPVQTEVKIQEEAQAKTQETLEEKTQTEEIQTQTPAPVAPTVETPQVTETAQTVDAPQAVDTAQAAETVEVVEKPVTETTPAEETAQAVETAQPTATETQTVKPTQDKEKTEEKVEEKKEEKTEEKKE